MILNLLFILLAAIDMTPKRNIQSKDGNQTRARDFILLDINFKTMILILWDSFVYRGCVLIADNIKKKSVIFAIHVKVTSFFSMFYCITKTHHKVLCNVFYIRNPLCYYIGMKLSTKVHSTFFYKYKFHCDKRKCRMVSKSCCIFSLFYTHLYIHIITIFINCLNFIP